VTLPVAGLLAGSPWGWPSIFYVSGAVAIVWAAAWCYIGANSPAQHPFISLEERIYIETSLVHSSTVSSVSVHYLLLVIFFLYLPFFLSTFSLNIWRNFITINT
jgi:hypothetical protein